MHVAVINKQLITLENANASQNKQTNKIETKQKQKQAHNTYRYDINSSNGRGSSIRTHNKNGDAAVYGLCRLCAFSDIFIRMDYILSYYILF